MAMQRTQHRTIRGPGVGTVGVVAKQTRTRPAEFLILERRRHEELRQTAQQIVESDHQLGIRHQWEASTTRRLQHKRAAKRMEQLTAAEEAKLDARRQRLKALLAEEERLLLAEAAATVETTLDKQAKMRDRIKSLREKREAERQQIVEAKKQEQFRRNCDPVRAVQQQQNLKAVIAERDQQLHSRQRRQAQERAIDRMYDQMWLEDKHAKDAKAERDAAVARQRMQDQQRVLAQQREAVEEARERERLLKIEEEALRQQEAELLKQEEQRAIDMAARKRQQMRADLEAHNREAIAAKQNQQQAELEEDVKLLKETLAAAQGEDEVQTNRRQQMAREMQLYLQYVKDMKAHRAQFDQAVEEFHRQESEKAMKKLSDKLRREQAARDELMKQVMATRQEQVASKLKGIEQDRLEAEREYDELVRAIEMHDKLEAEEKAAAAQRRRHHAAMLQQQARENKRLREEQERQIEEEARRLREQDEAYEAKVHKQLTDLSVSGQRL
eukprot:TRINITY_DN8634_c0_g1_i1.p1 TRINITY_DN8634_c0_g1~~TRINITY_DN8634_c0_g1_i1.p1  ORF type:complete len:500 (+),score=140.25 TRINITY_DN8634_c0_g1_i1:146-1645(+)